MGGLRALIREELKRREWSRARLATETGLSGRLISDYLSETEPGDVRGESLLAILGVLGFVLCDSTGEGVPLRPVKKPAKAKPRKVKAGAR